MIFEENVADNFHSYLTIVFGTLTLFFAGFIISVTIKRKENNIISNKQ